MTISPHSSAKGRLTRPAAAVILALLIFGAQAGAQVGANGEIDGLTAKFIDVNGIRTRYYDYGEGEPIVLIHGGGTGGPSTANNWSRNIRGLAERFRILAVDRMAQGMTGAPKDDADFNSRGRDEHIYQFIRTLNLGQVHLVGHSSGGGTAFYLALEHPEVVKTLILVARAEHMPPPGEGPTMFDPLLEQCPPDRSSYEHRLCRLEKLGYVPSTFPPDYVEADDWMGNQPAAVEARERLQAIRARRQQGERQRQSDTRRTQAWEKARNGVLRMPILIYTGKQDPLAWDSNDAHDMLRSELGFFDIVGTTNPRVKMVVINEAGHFPYREHPEQFNADLMHFIDYWNNR